MKDEARIFSAADTWPWMTKITIEEMPFPKTTIQTLETLAESKWQGLYCNCWILNILETLNFGDQG